MPDESEQPQPRRDFIAAGTRYAALGGFAAYLGAQAIKRQRLANDPNCIRLYTCQDCVELAAGCRLPKAENFRAASTKPADKG